MHSFTSILRVAVIAVSTVVTLTGAATAQAVQSRVADVNGVKLN